MEDALVKGWNFGGHNVYESMLAELVVERFRPTIEPIQGNAGARSCRTEFLQFLRDSASALGALLIFDEVQASRLSFHGYNQAVGVRPYLVTLGKWIRGGMTFGAFGGRKGIMELYDHGKGRLTHAGTFNNNVVSMATGCAGLPLITEEIIEHLNNLGADLYSRSRIVASKYSIYWEEVSDNREVRENYPSNTSAVTLEGMDSSLG